MTYTTSNLGRTFVSLVAALLVSTVTLAATTGTGPIPSFPASAGPAIA